jgi:hypothetical protein
MEPNENNASQEKEEIPLKNNDKPKNFYPQPTPIKPSNEDIRRQLGWYLR